MSPSDTCVTFCILLDYTLYTVKCTMIQCIVSIGLRGVHLVNKQAFICLIISHKSSEYSWIGWNGHCAQICADKLLKLHALMFGWPKSALIPRKWCGFRCISWSPFSFCGINIWGVCIHAYFWLIPLIHPISTSTSIYIPLTKQIWNIIHAVSDFFYPPSQQECWTYVEGTAQFWCRASCCVPWFSNFGCSIMTVALLDQRSDGNRLWGGSDKPSFIIKFIVLVLLCWFEDRFLSEIRRSMAQSILTFLTLFMITFFCITRMNTIKEDFCLCIFADWKVLALHCGKDIYSVLYHIKPQKVRETAELYWNIASRILRKSCSISPVYRNIMIGTKTLPVSSISLKILLRMLKNRWKWQKTPNWIKIPRGHFLKWHHRVASTRKPYGRKKNFAFISHRKKVRWTTYELWPPSWILVNSERCHMIWALGPSFY